MLLLMYALGFIIGVSLYAVPAAVVAYFLFIRPKRQLKKELERIEREQVAAGLYWL